MDRPRPPGDRDRWPAASLTDSDPLEVCLERTVELDNVRLHLRDWPGFGGPLVHLPDRDSDSEFIDCVAELVTPAYRVVSISPREDAPYQVDVVDLLGVLDQFGFEAPIVIGERLGCVSALLVAAWYPARVAGLVLVEPDYAPPSGESVAARALRDCPPDWPKVRAAIGCPVCQASSPAEVQRFLVKLP